MKANNSITSLYFTGFLQVYFIGVNTYFIAYSFYVGVFIAGFIISYIWTINVRRIAIGTTIERFIYAFGAACGGIIGLFTAEIVTKILLP